ncbi:hypothetical protein RHGRI_016331 [Rhododendron griersonianum]|uniref:Transposase n=1 Tax=Rhododendron griersonianum TaxID=479676 RepID=A0AAV6JTS3_9ERIC|nr:hypothetical protein RHGRI_016331 [Rhododendron griersonianum]
MLAPDDIDFRQMYLRPVQLLPLPGGLWTLEEVENIAKLALTDWYFYLVCKLLSSLYLSRANFAMSSTSFNVHNPPGNGSNRTGLRYVCWKSMSSGALPISKPPAAQFDPLMVLCVLLEVRCLGTLIYCIRSGSATCVAYCFCDESSYSETVATIDLHGVGVEVAKRHTICSLRPNTWIDAEMLTEIEKERQETIKHNLKELEAVGIDPARLKSMAMSLFGSKPKANGESTKEGNNKVGHGADPDYIPPKGVEILSSYSDNDESSRSQAKKTKVMGPGKKRGTSTTQTLRKSQRIQKEGASPNGATSSLPTEPTANHAEGMSVMVAQPSELPTSPTDETNQHSSLPNVGGSMGSTLIPSKKRVRGPTRGINVDKERKKLGHPIPVEIDREAMAIVGDYSSSVAYAIGESIRSHAPVRDIEWGDIDFGIKESIILRVGQTFGLGDYKNDMVLRRIIDFKCQALYRDWKCRLHDHYKVIKKEVSDPQNHPLYPCNLEDWKFMIKKVWRKKAFKVKKENREQSFPERFKDTHIRHRHGEEVWINDKAKEVHAKIAKKIAEQSQPGVTNPQSEVQVSIDVLGKRSGYLKGYGIRKRTYATQSQVVPNSEVVALKEVVADQAKLLVDYAKKFETMMLFMATKNGVDPATIPGLISSNENGEDTSIGQEDGIST